MNNTSNTYTKYRPSLTGGQIAHIVRLAKLHISDYQGVDAHSLDLSMSYDIAKVLAPFLAKIDNNAISPAYVATPRPTILDSLEGTGHREKLSGEAKVAHNHNCYLLYQLDPTNCTLSTIAAAKEHMYVNDLMTPEEEATMKLALYKIHPITTYIGIYNMCKPDPSVVHNIYNTPNGFFHSLSITTNGITSEGKRVGYTEIARCHAFGAIVDLRCSALPKIFIITEVCNAEIRVHNSMIDSTKHKPIVTA